MPERDVERVIRAVYEAYETREFEAAAQHFAEDAEVVNVPTGDRYQGPDGYLQFARGWVSAFPDLSVDVTRVGGGENVAVAEYLFRGTHTGAVIANGGFIPPTWSHVDFPLCDAIELEGGQIRRLTCYFDAATMLRQMGLFPNNPLHASERRASLDLYATEVDASAQQRNKAIVHRFLEEVVNQKNPAAAAAVCAGSVQWHGGAMGETTDLPAFQSQLASIFTSFPDLTVEVHDLIAEQDRVAVRLTMRGTQLGEFQGVPPTGKKISSPGLNTYRIAENQIVEEWWQNDLLGVMRQIDALPATAKSSP
ncbi:MAG TPA: ester cyclase family protein [Longimicrobiaceae bacterium]|nr:ester cyclase family protein [Longimicrobiaceae bacterium]